MFNKKNIEKIKGSGVLVIILTAVVFMIYSASTYSEELHFELLQKKYENDIINYYNSNVNNIDEVYDNLVDNTNVNY